MSLKIIARITLMSSVISLLLISSHSISAEKGCKLGRKEVFEQYLDIYKRRKFHLYEMVQSCSTDRNYIAALDDILSLELLEIAKNYNLDLEKFSLIKDLLYQLSISGYAPSQYSFASIHNANPEGAIYKLNDGIDLYTYIYWIKMAASQGEPHSLLDLARSMNGDFLPYVFPDNLEAERILNYLADQTEKGNIDIGYSAGQILGMVSYRKIIGNKEINLTDLNIEKYRPKETYKKEIYLDGIVGISSEMRMIISVSDNDVSGVYLYNAPYVKWRSKFNIKGRIDGDAIKIGIYNERGEKEELMEGKILHHGNSYLLDLNWQRGSEKEKMYFASRNIFDEYITCDEMTYFSPYVFLFITGDLGSGHSDNTFSFDFSSCENSIDKIARVNKILSVAWDIRGDKIKYNCSGSIWYMHHRYLWFNLLKTSYAPELLVNKYPEKTENVLEYLKYWSEKEIYNYTLLEEFENILDSSKEELKNYYKSNLKVDILTAEKYAGIAIDNFIQFAAGSFSYNPNSDDKDEVRFLILSGGSLEKLSDMFKGSKRDPSTYLHDSANSFVFTQFLLELGAETDFENWFGKTALYYAIQFNNVDVVKLLLSKGANPNHRYKSKNELYKESELFCQTIFRTKRTPLMHAAQHSTQEILEVLLLSGARLTDEDENGDTALEYSKFGNKPDNEKYLISRKLNPGT